MVDKQIKEQNGYLVITGMTAEEAKKTLAEYRRAQANKTVFWSDVQILVLPESKLRQWFRRVFHV